MKLKFWLRWAGRDLRQRWLQVAAIALIIALGTGIYAGFGGQETWRVASLDKSYAALNMYDLRLTLTTGSYLPQEEAVAVLSVVKGVTAVEPRLLVDMLLEVAGSDPQILVLGQMIGVDPQAGGPHVNQTAITAGRALTAVDSNQAILEYKFARYHGLEPGATLRFSGGLETKVVGIGHIPEYFIIIPPGQVASFMQEASFAPVVMPLSAVQAYAGHPDQVNDILIRLADGAETAVVQQAIVQALAASFPGVGVAVTTGAEDPAYNLLYSDAREDQATWDLLAYVFLIGAALAAFNLAGRIFESQRRQIGISMALGVPRLWIAVRPLLMGVQIAFLGAIFGLPLGLLFGRLLANSIMELVPLPAWSDALLHWPSFFGAAALGLALPVLATLFPVWQAVRVPPLEAIHGHLVARSSGLNRWLKGVWLPGNTFAQMPLKNVLRSTRRAVLMILGVATAVILLTLFLGLLDTIEATIDRGAHAMLYRSADRLIVNLNTFYPANHPLVANLLELTTADGRPMFNAGETGLFLGGHLRTVTVSAEAIPITLEFFDPDSAIWTPNLLAGNLRGEGQTPGLIISQKMAADWGLQVGDTTVLEHPLRTGLTAVSLVESEVIITGIHDNPMRSFSYVDRTQAPFTGLEEATNALILVPAPGIELEEIRRVLFAQPGVAAVQPVSDLVSAFDATLEILSSFLRVVQSVVILLAFLIAYNATSINMDDRIREIATMFAFGLRPRTVLWIQMGENLLLGLMGTAVGLALGWPLLQRFMIARMESQYENIGLIIALAPATLLLIVLLSAGVMALTPLVNYRRLQRINIPNTLRVME